MRRRTIVVVFVTVAGLALTAWAVLVPPQMPGEWRQIEIGMERDAVSQTITDPVNDMLDLKGFDATGRTYRFLGTDSHWVLTIRYDDNGRVSELNASTSNGLSGLFDQEPWTKGG